MRMRRIGELDADGEGVMRGSCIHVSVRSEGEGESSGANGDTGNPPLTRCNDMTSEVRKWRGNSE